MIKGICAVGFSAFIAVGYALVQGFCTYEVKVGEEGWPWNRRDVMETRIGYNWGEVVVALLWPGIAFLLPGLVIGWVIFCKKNPGAPTPSTSARPPSKPRPPRLPPVNPVETAWICLMARVARADGPVQPGEVEYLNTMVLQKSGGNKEALRAFVRVFEKGKAWTGDITEKTDLLRQNSRGDSGTIRQGMRELIYLAKADGPLNSQEIDMLWRIGRALGMEKWDFEAMAGIKTNPRVPSGDSTYRQCLALLGLAPGFGPEELKKAYKAKVKRCHPDHLNGVSLEARALAENKLKEINVAYAALKGFCQERRT